MMSAYQEDELDRFLELHYIQHTPCDCGVCGGYADDRTPEQVKEHKALDSLIRNALNFYREYKDVNLTHITKQLLKEYQIKEQKLLKIKEVLSS